MILQLSGTVLAPYSAVPKVHYSEDRGITVRVSFRVRARDRFMVNFSRSRLVGLGLGIIGLGL